MSEYLDRSMDIGEFVPQPDDDIIICRCEEITRAKSGGQSIWDFGP